MDTTSSLKMFDSIGMSSIEISRENSFISCNVSFHLGDDDKKFCQTHDTGPASLISDSSSTSEDSFRLHYYTCSEVRRHNIDTSAWIVAGDDIYDVTEYVEHHPGGKHSIMKKVGGIVDCTQDLMFHSKSGQKYWKQFLVGKVTKNPSKNGFPIERDWWRFWE